MPGGPQTCGDEEGGSEGEGVRGLLLPVLQDQVGEDAGDFRRQFLQQRQQIDCDLRQHRSEGRHLEAGRTQG